MAKLQAQFESFNDIIKVGTYEDTKKGPISLGLSILLMER